MKVVVQNGSNHGLSRSTVERMLTFFPSEWDKNVAQILLCGGNKLEVSFHEKDRILSLAWPRDSPRPTAADAIRMLVAALDTLSERGMLPNSFRPLRKDETEVIASRCIGMLSAT
jgi:hypothetical protein